MKTLNMLLCTIAIIMGTTTYAESKPVTQEPDSLMQVIESRRSIRRYTDEKIDRQTLEYIVKAGAFAPSSYGQNPVEFVVVEDSKTLKAVASAKRIGAPSVNDAAAAIIVIADTSKGELWAEDASVAAGYILLAAEQKGIGTCWNQIRLRDGQRLSASNEIKEILGIPSRYEVLCVVALGHPAESKPAHTEQEMNVKKRTHFGKF